MIYDRVDWLDSACWNCGSPEVTSEGEGPLLCTGCGDGLQRPVENGLEMVRRLHWQAHVLERCWRCLAAAVDPEDDLGLCTPCKRR